MKPSFTHWLDFSSRVAVVTGGTGVLLRPSVRALGKLGRRLLCST